MKTPRLFRSSTLPIGIDLSATGAKLLQLRQTRHGYAVVSAARIEASPNADASTPQERMAPVLEAIAKRWQGTGMHGRRCVVGVGRSLVRTRSIRQPRMPLEEAERAVQYEAPDRLGFEPDDPSEIAWIRAGEVRQSDQLRDEVIVIGAATATLEWVIDSLADAGLRPIATEPSFVSSARCFERAGRRESDDDISRVLIDVGMGSTDLTLLRGSSITFYKTLDVGGARMNSLVAERLGLDADGAADLRTQRMQPSRRTMDLPRDERTERAVFEAIRPAIDELAREVAMCLRYYAVSFTGARPSYALVMGGEAAESGLVEQLQRGVGLPCRLARPFDGVSIGDAFAGAADAARAQWAAAVGLSLRGSGRAIDRAPILLGADGTSAAGENDERRAA